MQCVGHDRLDAVFPGKLQHPGTGSAGVAHVFTALLLRSSKYTYGTPVIGKSLVACDAAN